MGKRQGVRKEIFYITDDGDLSAFRYDKWKIMFLQQKAVGIDVWREPFVPLRAPYITDLRADPLEHAVKQGASYEYDKWWAERMFLFLPAQTVVGNFLGTFKEFPPRQKPGSFSVGDVLEKIQAAHSSAGR